MAYKINIVSKMNGVGLDQDVKLIAETLQNAGFDVSVSRHHRIKSLWRVVQRDKKFDANIFIERVHRRWLGLAKKNFLIPNQERFPKRQLGKLKNIDAVFAKTAHAVEAFSQYCKDVELIGFTSNDLYDPGVEKHYDRFLHLAGKSKLKGTETILAVWAKHPNWPRLSLLQHGANVSSSIPSNAKLISTRIDGMQLKQMMNEHGIHLCPSRAEGWGHYIAEAMSCAAVVVTADGPPMNELVLGETGELVDTFQQRTRHLGVEYFIDENAFEQMIEKLIDQGAEISARKGERARQWFLNNDSHFREHFPKALMARIQ